MIFWVFYYSLKIFWEWMRTVMIKLFPVLMGLLVCFSRSGWMTLLGQISIEVLAFVLKNNFLLKSATNIVIIADMSRIDRIEIWFAKKRVSVTLWILRIDGSISGFICCHNPGPGNGMGLADYTRGSACLQIASLFSCLLNNLLEMRVNSNSWVTGSF